MSAQPEILRVSEPAIVRLLQENDLPHADRIFRLAFGTFLGFPDPTQFYASADYVRTRWLADPEAAFGAELNGEIVGSNFATNWGSIGFFGPLTVRPDLWDRGIAKRLLVPVMDTFSRWGTKHAGLFTFAQSSKHVGLYQKFGFWPRFLTAIMSKPVAQKLGETVLLWEEGELMGLAVCHCGPSTEAGNDTCYVKFGAVRPAKKAPENFEQLLRACEGLARRRNLPKLVAGVNMGRHRAYRKMIAAGFRTELQGVTMHRPNEVGYDRPTTYLTDDWR